MQEIWDTKRCKRVVRPLLSKIHSLTQSVIKSPGILDFQLDPPNNKSSLTVYAKPSDSLHRLKCLKPHITPELFIFYEELYNIFKQIINSIEFFRTKSCFPKLSTICSYDIGKGMVISCRTSYYKLNHSALFDSATLPANIKEYHDRLSPDIDAWLDMEPRSIFQSYKMDKLVGYIIHLIVFNRKVLYLLIPILIHWLYEELILQCSMKLKYLSSYLFHQFWNFNEKYYDNINFQIIEELTGIYDVHGIEIFWKLEKINYWYHLISSMDIKSNFNDNHYNNLLLNILPRQINQSLDLQYIYTKLYDHPQVTNTLAIILTYLIENKTRDDALSQLNQLISIWLGFNNNANMIFNSLVPGNDDLFNGVIKFHRYLTNRSSKGLLLLRCFYLDLPVPHDITDDIKIIDDLMKLQSPEFINSIPLKNNHKDVNELIFWLIDTQLIECSKYLFLAIYGDYDYYDEVDTLYYIVFNE